MVQQLDVNIKTRLSLSESFAYAQMMLHKLHAGGGFFYYSTKAPFGGYEQDWRLVTGGLREPKPVWVADKQLYFSVNPHLEIPKTNGSGERKAQKWVRGTVENIAAINALFCEIDAKDTIREDEWLPQYVAPDLTVYGDERQKITGALKRAQTAAIEATLPMNLAEYKRRAFEVISAAPVRPSACWDSGGGYQAVWFLNETLPITADNRALVSHVQKQWVAKIGGDPAASDLNRVLRLPGSTNHKSLYGPNGQPVVFLWCDLEVTYSFNDLAAMVPAAVEKKSVTRRVYVPAGYDPKLGEFAPVPDLPRNAAIAEYNVNVSMRDLLLECGYTDAGGGRMSRPGQPQSAGVQVNADNTANFFSAADLMYCEHRLTPAHVLCVYRFGGDVAAMLEWLTNGRYGVFLAALDRVRYWGRTTNFSTVEPSLLTVCADGSTRYYSDSVDTKVFDALCDEWQVAGSFTTKAIGKKRLASIAGVSPQSAQAAIERLSRFIVTTEPDPDGYGVVITFNSCRFEYFDPLFAEYYYETGVKVLNSTPINATTVLQLDIDEYAPRKAHDVFQSGVSRHVRVEMQRAQAGSWWKRPEADRPDPAAAVWDKYEGLPADEWEAQREAFMADMDVAMQRKPKPTREQREWDKRRRGLGEKALRFLDALLRVGDMTAQELAQECGTSLSTARSTLARLYAFMPECLVKEREGARGKTVWGILPEAFDEAESRAHELKTYKMQACREERRLEDAQMWALRQQKTADNPVTAKKATRRLEKLTKQRIDNLGNVYDDMDVATKHRMAVELPVKQWTQKRAAMEAAHQERIDREEFRSKIEHIANLHAEDLAGLTRSEASYYLRMAEYDAADTHLILDHLEKKGGVLKGTLPYSPLNETWVDEQYAYQQERILLP